MYLIYVNKIGKDFEDKYLYEFLFSESIEDVDGEDWDSFPALNNPSPPNKSHVNVVGDTKTDVDFFVIQSSESFSVWDAVDGVVALAWENILTYEDYPDDRLCFKFGMTLEDVENLLNKREIKLILNEKKII